MDWERRLERASGFLDLGIVEDAANELEGMTPEDRARPEVFGLRLGFSWQQKVGRG
jgi:hypothetical protein